MAASTAARRITLISLLVAFSVVGSYIRLGPTSIAFDAAGGFLAALLLGPAAGAMVCFLGHLAVAALTGFPLTPPFHLAVALTMALVGALGGITARRFPFWAAGVVMIAVNGVVAPAVLALLPNPMGRGLFAAFVLPLTLAAAANAVVAVMVAIALKRARIQL